MKKQTRKDKMDESLGMRRGKESSPPDLNGTKMVQVHPPR